MSTAAIALLLDWRAFHRTKGTKYAAITKRWLESGMTAATLVEIDARVGRHGFHGCNAALWASKDGFENNLGFHRMVSSA
jgi:hypothetical protein